MNRVCRLTTSCAAVIAIILINYEPALACTPPPNHRRATVYERARAADIVVAGRVVEVTEPTLPRYAVSATIEVSMTIKGASSPAMPPGPPPFPITVGSYGPGGLCLSDVHVGMQALFFIDASPQGSLVAHYQPQIDATEQLTAATIREAMLAIRGYPVYLPGLRVESVGR